MPSDREPRLSSLASRQANDNKADESKTAQTAQAIRSKAMVLKRWSLASLDDIPSKELSPMYWSENILKGVAALSNHTSLEEARVMLADQINRRHKEDISQRKTANSSPRLIRADLDNVLTTRGFRQKRSSWKEDSTPTTPSSGPRPSREMDADESPTLGSVSATTARLNRELCTMS